MAALYGNESIGVLILRPQQLTQRVGLLLRLTLVNLSLLLRPVPLVSGLALHVSVLVSKVLPV